MDVAQDNPGRFVSRDIARGEAVEHELNQFIVKRHDQRVASEGEREIESVWLDAERRQTAARREANRLSHGEHHERLAATYRQMAEHHAGRAQLLEGA